MKPGDKFPVTLDQWTVAEATVVTIEDGQVTLDVPATRIVMGVRTSLADLEVKEPEREIVMLGGERDGIEEPVQNSPVADKEKETGVVAPTKSAEPPAPVYEGYGDAVGEGLAGIKLEEID